MSIFGSIMKKIFGERETAGAEATQPTTGPATSSTAGQQTQPSATSMTPAAQAARTATAVDVEAVLTGLASQNPQKLDWRHSIVDLMKLLNLDSSLEARRELAQELSYSGSTTDTATMNIWLHKQVITKLAENGGRVPDDLRG